MSGPMRHRRSQWINRLRRDLRANKTKTRMLALLSAAFVAAWFNVFLGSSSARAKKGDGGGAVSPVSRPIEAPAPAVTASAVGTFDLPIEELFTKLNTEWEPRWKPAEGERPFGTSTIPDAHLDPAPDEATSTSRTVDEEVRRKERERAMGLIPSATFLSRQRGSLVRIKGDLYRPGDRVDGLVLVGIREREIVLRGQHGTYKVGIPLGDGSNR